MKKIDMIEQLYILFQYRSRIIKTVFYAALISLIVAFILPKKYTSSAVLYPPAVEGGMSLPLSGLGAIAGNLIGGSAGFQLPMLATPSDVWVTILKSNKMAFHLINKYDLWEYYSKKDSSTVLISFSSDFDVEMGREGTVKISYTKEEDPQGAYDIVNEAVAYLDTLNQNRDLKIASNKRLFIEDRLSRAKKELVEAETNLVDFQKENNVISLPEQTSALISNLSSLISSVTMQKIELSAYEEQFTGNSSIVFQLRERIQESEKVIDKLYSRSDSVILENSFLPAFQDVPDLGVEYLRLMRNLKISEILYELLVQQYEKEKINEVKNTPSIQILDPPFVPDYKSKPKRAIIIIVSVMLAFFLSVFSVYMSEGKKKLAIEDPEKNRMIDEMMSKIKKDFGKLIFWRKK